MSLKNKKQSMRSVLTCECTVPVAGTMRERFYFGAVGRSFSRGYRAIESQVLTGFNNCGAPSHHRMRTLMMMAPLL
jgi:hypothetical protein